MKKISELLSRFKSFGLKEDVSKKAVLKALNDNLGGFEIGKGDIVVKNDIVFVKSVGAVKSEILLKKKKILSEAGNIAGELFSVKDIR